MDLAHDTAAALDWPALLAALAEQARTPMGRRACLAAPMLEDAASVRHAFDAVDEVLALEKDGGWVPVGGITDIGDPVGRAGKSALLDKGELRAIGVTLLALHDLSDFLAGTDTDIPVLRDLVPSLTVDPGLRDVLSTAFDATGDLSEQAWPVLGELRRRIADLHHAIRRTLDDLVHGEELQDALQDRYVTQRGDRYVLPIKVGWKRKDLGIVHGMSGSGQTAFIEPTQVVALNNELRLAEGELEATERRILQQLSSMVGRFAEPLLRSLEAAALVDLACARAGLARALDAVRPIVRQDGVVALHGARHPLLSLRRVPVVPNDLSLNTAQPMLIISGPNTGGKTVALKTLGLCALLVRVGCFVPASAGSRVDLFGTVVALIGDHQTVHGDQSSFSSHLAALKEMLDHTTPDCLFLIDEIASGTDPQQGAALAHAILESLLDRGAKAVVTTHFHRLKTVGATDARFAMGGMQFADGRPTFRLLTGSSGESHAISVAERLGFDADLVERARALMGDDERSLADVLSALERERIRAEEATEQARRLASEMASQQTRLAERERLLVERARKLEEDLAANFRNRLSAAEAAIGAVVADLQRDPTHRKVDAARATVEALRQLAPEPRAPQHMAPAAIEVGDRVRLRRLGKIGDVLEVGEQLTVQVGPLTVRVAATEVIERFDRPAPRVPPPRHTEKASHKKTDLSDALKLPANTIDLRGQRVEDGLEAIDRFFDQAGRQAIDVVFILHGHGSGAMKDAVRRWLPTHPGVATWQAADASQGGDAFTIVELR